MPTLVLVVLASPFGQVQFITSSLKSCELSITSPPKQNVKNRGMLFSNTELKIETGSDMGLNLVNMPPECMSQMACLPSFSKRQTSNIQLLSFHILVSFSFQLYQLFLYIYTEVAAAFVKVLPVRYKISTSDILIEKQS